MKLYEGKALKPQRVKLSKEDKVRQIIKSDRCYASCSLLSMALFMLASYVVAGFAQGDDDLLSPALFRKILIGASFFAIAFHIAEEKKVKRAAEEDIDKKRVDPLRRVFKWVVAAMMICSVVELLYVLYINQFVVRHLHSDLENTLVLLMIILKS